MSANYYELLKYAATGQASPSMTYYDRMRASMLMGGAVQTLTGQPPISFKSDGTPLISWSMKGNGQQTGTPTPDAPVAPDFVGTLSGSDWTIPITCAGHTVPVYLGEVSTVRRVKKLELTGNENFISKDRPDAENYMYVLRFYHEKAPCFCSHLQHTTSYPRTFAGVNSNQSYNLNYMCIGQDLQNAQPSGNTVEGFKEYLAAQYANGTPVTIWYVLAEPETVIVNEPLCKIGDYADELYSTDAGVTIPTANGDNTLTVGTTLQPSEMSITGHIKAI